jgi:transcriptional regulator with XRE-family HTH domain
MTARQRIGRNFRRIRRAADLSQETVAERAGVHRTQISLYDWGEREPLTLSSVKLAAALDVEPAELLDGVRWDPAGQRFVVEEEA